MKKVFIFPYLVFLWMTMCLTFTACGNDSKDTVSDDPSSIVGMWKYDFHSGYVILIFNADNTYRELEYDYGQWEDDHFGTYLYNATKGELWMMEDGDDHAIPWEVILLDSKKLVFPDGPWDQGVQTFNRYTGSVPDYPAVDYSTKY